jgi:hypothetical protein
MLNLGYKELLVLGVFFQTILLVLLTGAVYFCQLLGITSFVLSLFVYIPTLISAQALSLLTCKWFIRTYGKCDKKT